MDKATGRCECFISFSTLTSGRFAATSQVFSRPSAMGPFSTLTSGRFAATVEGSTITASMDAFSTLTSGRFAATRQAQHYQDCQTQLSVPSHRVGSLQPSLYQRGLVHHVAFSTLTSGRFAATVADESLLFDDSNFQYPHIGSVRCNPVITLDNQPQTILSVPSHRVGSLQPRR